MFNLNNPANLATTIEAFTGGLGSGKTMSAVSRAYELCYLSGTYRQLITNMKSLHFPGAIYISDFKDLEYWIGRPGQPGQAITSDDQKFVILIDELGIWANSIDWQANYRMDGSGYTLKVMLPQLRKRNCCFLYTIQRYAKADTAVRAITDIQIECKYLFFGVLQKLTLPNQNNLPIGTRFMVKNDIVCQNYDTREMIDQKYSHNMTKFIDTRLYKNGFITHSEIPDRRDWDEPNNIIASDYNKIPEDQTIYHYHRMKWLSSFGLNIDSVPYHIHYSDPYLNISISQQNRRAFPVSQHLDIIPTDFQTIQYL